MTDKELLEQRFRDEKVSDEDLAFGRIMPFGKHKGMYLYRLLIGLLNKKEDICYTLRTKTSRK